MESNSHNFNETLSTLSSIENEREITINKCRVDDIVGSLERKFSRGEDSLFSITNVVIPNETNEHKHYRLKSPLLDCSSDNTSSTLFSPEKIFNLGTLQESEHPVDKTQVEYFAGKVSDDFPSSSNVDNNIAINENMQPMDVVNIHGESPFCIVTSQCFLEGIKFFLNSGSDLSTYDSRHYNILHLVCEYNDKENDPPYICLEYILDNFPTSNLMINQKGIDGKTPLHLAAERGDLRCVILLLMNGATNCAADKDKNTPLHLASYGNYLLIMKVLVDYVNWTNNSSFESILNELSPQLERVIYASEENQQSYTMSDMQQNLNPNCTNRTINGENCNLKMVHHKIEPDLIPNTSNNGHLAIWNKFFENATSKAQRNFEQKPNGEETQRFKNRRRRKKNSRKVHLNDRRIIELALQKGDDEYLQILAESGFDLHTSDEEGNTLLHIVSAYGKESVVFNILDGSGDEAWRLLRAKNMYSQTAMDMAVQNNQKKCIETIKMFYDQKNSALSPKYDMTNPVDTKVDGREGSKWGSLFGSFFSNPLGNHSIPPPPPPITIDATERTSVILSP